MSRQDKATTDKFARTLRELVKQPENKVCADCKRNDPRWASWNIGVFLCIRCSGIHRGMGTHISKVKSIDLDTWTPEQMESIKKWGNFLANLYWEAHLRAGHVPPEHKMESFIRSKYETRRWALDGPPPIDPSVLAKGARVSPPVNEQPQKLQQPQQTARQPQSGGTTQGPSAPTRQPQTHQLLSANYTASQRQTNDLVPNTSASVQAEPPVKAPENDLFALDFHAPPISSNTTTTAPKKDVKQDILSLFSNASPAAAPAFGQYASATWNTQQPQSHSQQPQVTSMIGTSGIGAWGASSGWENPAQQTQHNLWGASPAGNNSQQQQQQQTFSNTTAVWGSPPTAAAAPRQDLFGSLGNTGTVQKKDDAFGDLWGGFK